MDREWLDTNRESLDQLEAILKQKKNSGNTKIVVFAGAAISMHAPTRLPAANSMLDATIKVLLYDPVLSRCFQQAGLLDKLYQVIYENCASLERVIPPEMVYDAIYEYGGKKVFAALECLKSNSPNRNHKILAALLDRGFIDRLVTTNFDSLIEQSLSEGSRDSSGDMRIWKIHGDIRRPLSMVTTMRRVGQTAFDEDLVKDLKELLDGSHVIFIGYSGLDPDLMPAFKTANMACVYWCVYRAEELKAGDNNSIMDRDPCKTIHKNGTPIRWIIGDLQTEFLSPLAEKVFDTQARNSPSLASSERAGLVDPRDVSPLEVSSRKWERNIFRRLSPAQKAGALLQILYDIALYSPEPQEALMVLIEAAEAMEKHLAFSKDRKSKFKRDLGAFQAEAYLKLAELVGQLSKDAIVDALSDPETRRNLDIFKRAVFPKGPIPLWAVVEKLHQPPLNISSSRNDEIVHQLFVRAKDQLTPILPLPFRDSIQVQALLNASTILMSLAGGRSAEGAFRNVQGAEKLLEDGLAIADRASMGPDRRNYLKARCYSNLAVLSMSQGNLQRVLHYFGTAESLFKQAGDLYSYAGVCINTGLFLMDMYRATRIKMHAEEAAKYHQRAISTLNSFPNDGLAGAAARLGRELSGEI